MNPNDPLHPDDPDDLATVETAWQALPDEEPPALVDLAVRNAAQAAIERPRPWFWNMSWVHGLTTVGVLALAVTLLLQLRQDTPQLPDMSAPAHLDLHPAAEPMDAVRESPAQSAEATGDGPAPERARLKAATPPPATTVTDPGIEIRKQETAAGASMAAPAQDERTDDNAAAKRDAATFRAEPALQRQLNTPETDAQAEGESLRIEEAMMADEGVSTDLLESAAPASPEAWLEQILSLLADGDTETARQEWAAFRAAWPDHPLPGDFPLDDLATANGDDSP